MARWRERFGTIGENCEIYNCFAVRLSEICFTSFSDGLNCCELYTGGGGGASAASSDLLSSHGLIAPKVAKVMAAVVIRC